MMSKSQTWLGHDKSSAWRSRFPPVILLHHDHAHGKVKKQAQQQQQQHNQSIYGTHHKHSQPALILYEVQGCHRFAKKAQSEINEDPVLYVTHIVYIDTHWPTRVNGITAVRI
jgi:hypothetical protein